MEIYTEELFKKCRKILSKEYMNIRKEFENNKNAQGLLFAIMR